MRTARAHVVRTAVILVVGAAAPAVDASTSPGPAQDQPVGTNELISVRAGGGVPEHRASIESGVSGDGRYVAFVSQATGLVKGVGRPGVNQDHVYLRDRDTGTTTAIDVKPNGKLAEADSYGDWGDNTPSVSDDGTRVAFTSTANGIAPGGVRKRQDVFLRNTVTGTTETVSVARDGEPVEPSSAYSFDADISADGSTVVFVSFASNLVEEYPGENPPQHVYRRDLTTGTTTLVDRNLEGGFASRASENPSVSADGNLIVYHTGAVDVVGGDPSSDDSVILYDVAAGVSTLVSRNAAGESANKPAYDAQISADGSTVVYSSWATNLAEGEYANVANIFAYDVATGLTTLVSVSRDGAPTDGWSRSAVVDGDGSLVAFESEARNLTDQPDENYASDVFLRDLSTGTTTRLSQRASGKVADRSSYLASIAGDGSIVAYCSQATDLVPKTRWPVQRVYAYRVL